MIVSGLGVAILNLFFTPKFIYEAFEEFKKIISEIQLNESIAYEKFMSFIIIFIKQGYLMHIE